MVIYCKTWKFETIESMAGVSLLEYSSPNLSCWVFYSDELSSNMLCHNWSLIFQYLSNADDTYSPVVLVGFESIYTFRWHLLHWLDFRNSCILVICFISISLEMHFNSDLLVYRLLFTKGYICALYHVIHVKIYQSFPIMIESSNNYFHRTISFQEFCT